MADKLGEFDFKKLENIADELVKEDLVSKDQLAVAKVTQKNLGGDLGRILIKKNFVEEDELVDFVKTHFNIPVISISDYRIEPSVTKLVPQSLAQKYRMMPLFKKDDILTVAMSDPLSLFAIDGMKSIVKCDIRPVLTTKAEVENAINTHYRMADLAGISEDSIEVIDYTEGADDISSFDKLEEIASGAKVISVVSSMVFKAYKDGASDIHIEPLQDQLKVRYRIDGILEERMLLPKELHLPVVSRLKILSGMDIAEKRVPQDGRVNVKLMGERLDIRLSTYPTMYGEKVVLRLLPKEGVLTLEDLGFTKEEKEKFVDIITKPYGIFLVTGPTGSGKTTTLYAALQKVNSQERNIISIEDPIENEIPGVNQAQVNLKAGVTFASALRAILRQDPDIIMVGEIRDKETADIAVRSAMTGHLVFSTLHTNSAVGAIARLIDLGVEPFLISSALLGVMAQRLVRKICPDCSEEVRVGDDQVRELLGKEMKDARFFRGKGCKKCRMSGYIGRTGIFELVYVDEILKEIIARSSSEDEIIKYVHEKGVLSIREAGVKKALSGMTTIEEVLRVTEKG